MELVQFVFKTVGLPAVNLVAGYITGGIHTVFVLFCNFIITGQTGYEKRIVRPSTRRAGSTTKLDKGKGRAGTYSDGEDDGEDEQLARLELDPKARKFLRDAGLVVVLTYIVVASLYNWSVEKVQAETAFESADVAYQRCVKLSLPCTDEREARVLADINRGYVKLTWYVIQDIFNPLLWISARAWHMRPDLYFIETMTFVIISCVLLSVVCVAIFVLATVYQNFWPDQATQVISAAGAAVYARGQHFVRWAWTKTPPTVHSRSRGRPKAKNSDDEAEADKNMDGAEESETAHKP